MTALQWLERGRIVAIVRGLQPEYMLRLAEALNAGGIGLMEVTFNQADPDSWQSTAESVRALSRHMADRMLIGVGTVLTEAQLELARQAGARYIVTPNTNPGIIGKAKAAGLGAFPGAFTPTEIVLAHEAGADAVKVFPAGNMGPSYMKALLAPLRHIPLIAVGGIHEKNAADFMAAGCAGVGVGGNLVNQAWIADGKWDEITALAKVYRKAVMADE